MTNSIINSSTEQEYRKGGTIQTFTNVKFWPLDPHPEDINIIDIAHALSNKCRFSGHTSKFYSVAQHSVIVSKICDPKDALWGLLHDAAEAYLVDLPSPLKILPEWAWFVDVENTMQRTICKHFGLDPHQPESTHHADKVSLVTEKRDLMPEAWDWQKKHPYQPLETKIKCWGPIAAEKKFLQRFKELTSQKK